MFYWGHLSDVRWSEGQFTNHLKLPPSGEPDHPLHGHLLPHRPRLLPPLWQRWKGVPTMSLQSIFLWHFISPRCPCPSRSCSPWRCSSSSWPRSSLPPPSLSPSLGSLSSSPWSSTHLGMSVNQHTWIQDPPQHVKTSKHQHISISRWQIIHSISVTVVVLNVHFRSPQVRLLGALSCIHFLTLPLLNVFELVSLDWNVADPFDVAVGSASLHPSSTAASYHEATYEDNADAEVQQYHRDYHHYYYVPWQSLNIFFRLGPHSVLIMGKQCNGGPEVVMGWDSGTDNFFVW